MCGFVTPLQGSEADEHRKPEVAVDGLSTLRFPPAVGCDMGYGRTDLLGHHPEP